jgi:hypothetical protein
VTPESRIAKRSPKRLQVRFGVEKANKVGFTRNVSKTGLFIQTNLPMPPGTILKIEVAFPTRTFALRGLVVWAKKVPARLSHLLVCGMGIRLVQPPPEFNAFYEEWQQQ